MNRKHPSTFVPISNEVISKNERYFKCYWKLAYPEAGTVQTQESSNAVAGLSQPGYISLQASIRVCLVRVTLLVISILLPYSPSNGICNGENCRWIAGKIGVSFLRTIRIFATYFHLDVNSFTHLKR